MRPAAIGLSLQATAAYAASSRNNLAHVEPVMGNFLGYEFEWGPMIAGLLCCLAVRFFVRNEDPNRKIDYPISFLTLVVTFGCIQWQRPIPMWAIVYGTGIGALGVGIIRIALTFIQKNLGPFREDEDDDKDDERKPKP